MTFKAKSNTIVFCCERLSASMARSLHLKFSLCTTSNSHPGPGGSRTAASCQPQAWRPSAIPLQHRRPSKSNTIEITCLPKPATPCILNGPHSCTRELINDFLHKGIQPVGSTQTYQRIRFQQAWGQAIWKCLWTEWLRTMPFLGKRAVSCSACCAARCTKMNPMHLLSETHSSNKAWCLESWGSRRTILLLGRFTTWSTPKVPRKTDRTTLVSRRCGV